MLWQSDEFVFVLVLAFRFHRLFFAEGRSHIHLVQSPLFAVPGVGSGFWFRLRDFGMCGFFVLIRMEVGHGRRFAGYSGFGEQRLVLRNSFRNCLDRLLRLLRLLGGISRFLNNWNLLTESAILRN